MFPCERSNVLGRPNQDPGTRANDQRFGEPPQRMVAGGLTSKDDHAERYTGILEIQQVALDVLPGAPTRLDLEPDHGKGTIDVGYRRCDRPDNVESTARQGVLRECLVASALTGPNEECGQLAIEGMCIIHHGSMRPTSGSLMPIQVTASPGHGADARLRCARLRLARSVACCRICRRRSIQ